MFYQIVGRFLQKVSQCGALGADDQTKPPRVRSLILAKSAREGEESVPKAADRRGRCARRCTNVHERTNRLRKK